MFFDLSISSMAFVLFCLPVVALYTCMGLFLFFSVAPVNKATSMWSKIGRYVVTSRPRLWLLTTSLYLVPISVNKHVVGTYEFWSGFLWVTLPLNVLLYGWNDVEDQFYDNQDPRRVAVPVPSHNEGRSSPRIRFDGADTFESNGLWGPCESPEFLDTIPWVIITLNFPFLYYWMMSDHMNVIGQYMLGLVLCYFYNQLGWSNAAIYDLIVPGLGSLIVLQMSCMLNNIEHPPDETYWYCALLVIGIQLGHLIYSIEVSEAVGRRTTAVAMGIWTSSVLLFCFGACTLILCAQRFNGWTPHTIAFCLYAELWCCSRPYQANLHEEQRTGQHTGQTDDSSGELSLHRKVETTAIKSNVVLEQSLRPPQNLLSPDYSTHLSESQSTSRSTSSTIRRRNKYRSPQTIAEAMDRRNSDGGYLGFQEGIQPIIRCILAIALLCAYVKGGICNVREVPAFSLNNII